MYTSQMNYPEITKLLHEVPAYEAYRRCWQNQHMGILVRDGVIILDEGRNKRALYKPELEDMLATDWEINPFCNPNDTVY